MAENKEDFRHIVRVAGVDLNGNKKVGNQLLKIKGISFAFANTLCKVTGLDENKIVGHVSDVEVKKLEAVIKEPKKFNIPEWLYNRRADPEEGSDRHLVGADLTFTNQTEIRLMQKIKCNKGFRHYWRLPLRGQRTKSNFRRNKGKVTSIKRKGKGVQKRK